MLRTVSVACLAGTALAGLTAERMPVLMNEDCFHCFLQAGSTAQEISERMLALVREVLARYRPDGIEFDFLRS